MRGAAPLDPVALSDVIRALIWIVDLLRFDACVLQFIAVLDAWTELSVLLHHQFLHVLVVAIQQRLRQREWLEIFRYGGSVAIAGNIAGVAAACRTRLIVGTTTEILCTAAAARIAAVYR